MQSDSNGEYLFGEFITFCKDQGIKRKLIQGCSPHQNGVAEGKKWTLLKKVRSTMFEAKTPQHLWAKTINTSNFLSNRSPIQANSKVTPFQRFTSKNINFSKICIFGSVMYVHVLIKKKTKLQ